MLKLVNKPGSKKDIEDFKKGAEISPTPQEEKAEIRKITHWIQVDNWSSLKQLSTRLTTSGNRVTINMLLDEAVELLKHKYVNAENQK